MKRSETSWLRSYHYNGSLSNSGEKCFGKKIKAISLLIEIIWNLIQWISNQSFCRIKRWRHFWRKCTSTIQDWRQRTAAAIEQNLITKNYCSDSKLELFLFMGKIKSVPFLRESIRKKYASCTFLKGKCTDTFRDRQRKTTKAIEQKVDRSRQAILLYRGGECISGVALGISIHGFKAKLEF